MVDWPREGRLIGASCEIYSGVAIVILSGMSLNTCETILRGEPETFSRLSQVNPENGLPFAI